MNSQASVDTLPKVEANSAQRAVWAAFISVFVPGLGQLFLGKRRSGWLFLSLFAVLIWLFLPPLRLPKSYWAADFLILALLTLILGTSWAALQSGAKRGRRGLLLLLAVLVPVGCYVTLLYGGLMFRLGGFKPFRNRSIAMAPTVMEGDTFIVDTRYFHVHRPQPGDVVVAKSPNEQGVILIKRIVAIGGDTIRGIDGKVYINGKLLHEPYVEHVGGAPAWQLNFGPIDIPAHKLFVMGDNRDMSLDSRAAKVGLVDEKALLGKALYITNPIRDRKAIH